jgi:probable HAF family extracellular repeat protein
MRSTFLLRVEHAMQIAARAARSQSLEAAGIACLSLVLAGCGGLSPVQQQELSQAARQNRLYTIQDLGVFGANPSAPGGPLVVTNSGWISGAAGVGPGGTGPEHAVLYYGGQTIDVGTPGLGGNSMGYGVNESGVTAGEAEDIAAGLSTTEDFCGFQFLSFTSSPTPCVPFVWQNGQMVPLPTLGGVNGSATEINSSGMVGGYAETATMDPNCTAPQKYQFKPVVWSNGKVQALPTGNDADGLVTAVNDRGDAAGSSGSCAPLNPILLLYLNPTHALLWRNGEAINLGNLGGMYNNLPHGMNNLGQVVGESDLPGDQTAHAFLASPGTKMQDLGTVQDQVDNDTYSFGFGINNGGEIVGLSANADFSVIRAFIRRNGTLVDLNTLVTGNNSLYLLTACFINSKGEITGIAIDPNTGEEHTYLATPAAGASSAAQPAVKPPVLPDWVRDRFRFSRS